MIPTGKGSFLWLPSRLGDTKAAVQRMVDAGLQRIDIKISDGNRPYEVNRESGYDHTEAMIAACRKAGIAITGWSYVYGYSDAHTRQEAAMTVQRLKELGIDTLIIDAEGEFKRPGHGKLADRYCREVRNALPDLTVGLSSFRFPELHMDFPWAAWWPYVDFHCPQIYWIEAHNPVEQLHKSIAQLKALYDVPFVPAGYGYGGTKAAEMNAFDAEVRRLGLPGITWWEWFYIVKDPLLYEAIRSQEWGPSAGSGDGGGGSGDGGRGSGDDGLNQGTTYAMERMTLAVERLADAFKKKSTG